MKFKESTWKVQHMVYFGEREIMFSSCYKQAMVKKIQNSLTTSIFHLAIMVVLIRLAVIALK